MKISGSHDKQYLPTVKGPHTRENFNRFSKYVKYTWWILDYRVHLEKVWKPNNVYIKLKPYQKYMETILTVCENYQYIEIVYEKYDKNGKRYNSYN